MMPRPALRDNFHLTYRKIPVLAFGRDVYCDTSLISEALEHFFPPSEGYQSIYPRARDGSNYRSMMRGFASYWVDRPYFRATCGLMPASIWRSSFGDDRAGLIGHKLNPDKLERKLPENLSKLDMHLSILEPMLAESEGPWLFSTATPSLADIALYYQTLWGTDIAAGRYIENITMGQTPDETNEGAASVFNQERYPGVLSWFQRMQHYFDELQSVEDQVTKLESVLEQMKQSPALGPKSLLLPTPRAAHAELDRKNGLHRDALVSVAPDDTGKDDPTIGTLVALSPEEVVIQPQALESPASVETRIHFPRLGFVVRPVKEKGNL
ncbi:hypothetical protein DOTSEDRAFT_126826 [Dothistroma septosporum NZE10]|uniref:DUF7962 domain-containing protein n=1 Tax=Dothistroma septosporum (strain NZE10 / CBS 128990) TaxID=675120 RepID=N1PSS9_DOTSN|nr:hypothetical protein DOTSEDRAFT_126826 [Dothistroma septosporum NZE10]